MSAISFPTELDVNAYVGIAVSAAKRLSAPRPASRLSAAENLTLLLFCTIYVTCAA